jgi:hypothetical protein
MMNETNEATNDTPAKRALVGLHRRRQLLQLVASYTALLTAHPDLRAVIQRHIDDVLASASRTRGADRELVLDALRRWGAPGLSFADLLDETELSEWHLRSILAELMREQPALVGRVRRAPVGDMGRPAWVYFLLPE